MEQVLGSETSFVCGMIRYAGAAGAPRGASRIIPQHPPSSGRRRRSTLARALSLKEDVYSIPSLLLGARMLDYAGMKYIYGGNGRLFSMLGSHPSRADGAVLSGMGIECAQSRAHYGSHG